MTTQQVSEPKDMNRNPDGKGGFGDNPENRNPGGWKKENTISYQYNRYMNMSNEEFKEAKEEENRTMAMIIAYNRVEESRTSLMDVKEITDRTEGKAPQYIGLGDPKDAKKALVEFIHGTTDGQDTDTD